MQTWKMIVTDLDRTLLRNDKTVSDYTANVLTACQRQGMLLVFATARPERATHTRADLKPDYILSNNGATISHGVTVLLNRFIPRSTVDDLVTLFHSMPEIDIIAMDAGDRILTNGLAHNWGSGWNPVYFDFMSPASIDTVKISVNCANPHIMAEIARKNTDLTFYCSEGETWHIITHQKAQKQTALEFLEGHAGIPLAQMIAFGDDHNDIAMLSACGMGVAVANAIPEAKSAANAVCGSNEEDGVARWIEAHILT